MKKRDIERLAVQRRMAPQMSIGGNQAYEGAATDAYSSRFTRSQSSPDEELAQGIPVLRARNADLVRNDPVAYGVIDVIASGVVGRGPRMRSRAADEKTRDTIESLFREWAPRAHWDGVSTWADTNTGLVQAASISGDVLVTWPDVGDGTGPRVDLIDARRVDTPTDKTPECFACRLGVGYDKYGRVLGYYVRKADGSGPGLREEFHWFPLVRNGRINAYLFRRPSVSRPRQSRGVPMFAPAMHDLKNSRDARRTELRRAEQAAKVHGVIMTPDPKAIADAFENVDADATAGDTSIDQLLGRSYGNTPDGSYMVLGLGESYQPSNQPQPNSGFGDYVNSLNRFIAGCTGLPPEEAFRDYKGLNYSNARTIRLMSKSVYRNWRDSMETGVLMPTGALLVSWWWANGLLGRIPWSADLLAHSWDWDEQEYVDPTKEVGANAEAVQTSQRSIVEICAAQGRDWKEVIEQNLMAEKFEIEMRSKLGLPPKAIAPGAAAPAPAPMPEKPDDPEDDNA